MRRLAQAISILFHPLFVAFWGVQLILNMHFVVVAKLGSNAKMILIIHSMFGVALVIMPLLMLAMVYKKYSISSWMNLTMEERRNSGLLVAFIYVTIIFALKNILIDPILHYYLISLAIGAVLCSLAQFYFKVSYHAYAITSIIPLLVLISLNTSYELNQWLYFVVILTGIIGSARLYLKAHNLKQIQLGMVLGLIVNTIIYTISYGL